MAPGTLGSLVGVLFIWLVKGDPLVLLVLTLSFSVVAIWTSGVVAQDLGEHDPQIVVIDEVCGMMTGLLFLSVTGPILVVGFILFRFFDVVKPPPIRLLERIPKGFGIVLDDLLAGVYTNLILRLLIHYAHL